MIEQYRDNGRVKWRHVDRTGLDGGKVASISLRGDLIIAVTTAGAVFEQAANRLGASTYTFQPINIEGVNG